jgi:hypothetical protein
MSFHNCQPASIDAKCRHIRNGSPLHALLDCMLMLLPSPEKSVCQDPADAKAFPDHKMVQSV